ncbi:hypothetical protein [Williamsia sp.]|uniref:hypothetical protein n=1 Tax=Williamsia sp. TaxID=1872085 RepID=UPI001A3629F0|nr:hypothetical protein [Williamsia sp.]MBJ7289578.1 hypothetical protein [Williamsia sp.]
MVNEIGVRPLSRLRRLVGIYVAVVAATILALIVLSATAPSQAPTEAWVHAVIVAAFAVLLPLRLRAAERGSVRAVRAVGIIAAVLLVVNVVQALLPDLYPVWMRVEMVGIAVVMAGVIAVVVGDRT